MEMNHEILLRATITFILSCGVLTPSFVSALDAPEQPTQPTSGPGSSEHRHGEVTKSVYGTGDDEYWLFEPSSPLPHSAPLIVFNHGWTATNPAFYGAWIEHLVRRGNIVVYPRYQADLRTPTRKFTPSAIAAVKTAIQELQQGNHVKPELDKFAIVGHSAGGQVCANMAALALSSGLPYPRAVCAVQPGKSWSRSKRIAIPLADLSQIPEGTLLLAVVGDQDRVVRDIDAKRIIRESSRVPAKNKNLVVAVSDPHGEPDIRATHFAPLAIDLAYDSGERRQKRRQSGRREGGFLRTLIKRRLQSRLNDVQGEDAQEALPEFNLEQMEEPSKNALDYYGFWKLFDGLCDAAFYGLNREYALGNTPQQRFMGIWSDGTLVKEMMVIEQP